MPEAPPSVLISVLESEATTSHAPVSSLYTIVEVDVVVSTVELQEDEEFSVTDEPPVVEVSKEDV